MRSKSQTSNLVALAILGAISLVLRQIEFPILPVAPFLKVDFSEIPVLIGMFIQGPMGLVSVALIRDILNFIIKGGEAGLPVGAIMSFIASLAMLLPVHFLYPSLQLNKIMKFIIITFVSILTLVIAMSLFNYYVALPIYTTVLNFPIPNRLEFIKIAVIPFNICKGIIIAFAQWATLQWVIPRVIPQHLIYDKYVFNHN